MAHPRFALVIGGLRAGSSLTAWPDRDAPNLPRSLSAAWFAWRLLGGNNRELGRSATVYPDLVACRAATQALRQGVGNVTATLTVDVRRGMWRWRVVVPEVRERAGVPGVPDDPVLHEPVEAVASRMYLRQRECQYSLGQFVSGAAVAQLWHDEDDVPLVLPLRTVPLVIDLRDRDTGRLRRPDLPPHSMMSTGHPGSM